MPVSEAKRLFLTYLVVQKNRPSTTVDTYDKILRQFLKFIGEKSVGSLALDDIEQYATWLYERGCTAKTRRNKLAAIRSFVKYLYIKDLSEIKPLQVELPTVKNKEANFLTEEEAKKLVSVVRDTRDRALILTMLTTWARIDEVMKIQLHDIYKRSVIIKEGKGGEPRAVFINSETDRAIQKYLRLVRGFEPGPLFLNRYGKGLKPRMVRRLIARYAEEAGILKTVSPHTLRHTGATGYLDNGGTLEEANKILGHKSIYTTMLYLHFRDERLHKNYDKVTAAKKYTTSKR